MRGSSVKVSIIVPTFNERENIVELLTRIRKVLRGSRVRGEVIVVDDNSPDGTWKLVQRFGKKYRNVRLILRKNERGLSSAVVRGFKEARGSILCVMDADLSHPPEIIPELVERIKKKEGDLIIASRYVASGRVENWGLKRRLISRVATLLARLIVNVRDPLSGFFVLRKDVIKGVKLNGRGYKIGLEVIAKGNYRKIVEVPYTFKNRVRGRSKLTIKVMVDYLLQLFSLTFAKNSRFKYFLFYAVACTGVILSAFRLLL